ncbi:type IV secretory system conjugative DNA transfer family protein [Alicyclobacillus tolerans]|uniref:VirD4-like conjugal transfer protein, CD1115 family n=1 Tax=Alicyclobacillus tolerans TaxID=90970 RepID=UPI001F0134F0|nr:type IV secretory system conjugative DNA transfer family protein [Alicyclobacillus tolerans]MCF8566989.1 type IV secretory system conjugative DNA transfer family protein [Alicyclobacillus tolerans]
MDELTKAKPGFVLGKTGRKLLVHAIYDDPRRNQLNQNVFSCGQSGIGKSRTFLLPNILFCGQKMGDHLVITDTKGELYNKSSDFLRQQGYEIHVVNFQRDGFAKSERYNPLFYVKNLVDAQNLVNTILENTSKKVSNSDEMWKNAEAAYLTALIMFSVSYFPEKHRNLGSVVRFGVMGARQKEAMEALFLDLPSDDPARLMYESFGIAEDKTRTGILIGFSSRMKHFLNEEIVDLTAKTDFDFSRLTQNEMPVALFLMMENDDTFGLLPAMFFSQLFDFLVRYADGTPEGKLRKRVRFMLDEFANIGKINKFNSYMSIIRSREISVLLVLQMLSQLEDRYPVNEFKEILGNCDTQILLGTTSLDTAKYYSEVFGNQTILAQHVDRKNVGIGQQPSNSVQVEHAQRALITPDEILRLQREFTLVFQSGRYPAKVKKLQYDKLFPGLTTVDWHDELKDREERYRVFDPTALLDKYMRDEDENDSNDRGGTNEIDPDHLLF